MPGRQARAWSAFWQEQGGDSRCLAHAEADLRRTLEDHWTAFAASLPPGAGILDIGCGAGLVGRNLLAARPDLRITGVDLAQVPAPSDPRIELLPATPMERLPFQDEMFDAAVSQYGFEYGDVAGAAREAARVLKPGARFSFVVHHSGSPMVHEGRHRDRLLRALLGDGVKRAFLSGSAAALSRQLAPISSGAPPDPVIAQVAQALRIRIGFGRGQRIAVWNAIVDALAPERELIAALAAACVAPDRLAYWLARLSDRLEIGDAGALCRPGGEAIGWRIEGARSRHAASASRLAALG